MKLSILYIVFFMFSIPTYGQTTYSTIGNDILEYSNWLSSLESVDAGTTILLASTIEDFELSKEEHSLKLSWIAFDVKKGDRFLIQQSEDGVTFDNKAKIEIEEDAWEEKLGIELGLSYGTQYYRIKVEGAGGTGYSEIKSVRYNKETLGYKVYPNPCEDYFVIEGQTNSKSYVEVLDLMGKVVYQQGFKGGEISHHVEHELEAGLYSLRIIDEEAVSSKNIIVH